MKSSSKFYSSIPGVLILTMGYLLVHQLWYSGTPMGIDPVLDGKQNLLAAEKFYRGESFDDPFHRAVICVCIDGDCYFYSLFGYRG